MHSSMTDILLVAITISAALLFYFFVQALLAGLFGSSTHNTRATLVLPPRIDSAFVEEYNGDTNTARISLVLRFLEPNKLPETNNLLLIIKNNEGSVVLVKDIPNTACTSSVCVVSMDVNISPGDYDIFVSTSSGVETSYSGQLSVRESSTPGSESSYYTIECNSCSSCSLAFVDANSYVNLNDENVLILLTADIHADSNVCIMAVNILPPSGRAIVFDGGGHKIDVNIGSVYSGYGMYVSDSNHISFTNLDVNVYGVDYNGDSIAQYTQKVFGIGVFRSRDIEFSDVYVSAESNAAVPDACPWINVFFAQDASVTVYDLNASGTGTGEYSMTYAVYLDGVLGTGSDIFATAVADNYEDSPAIAIYFEDSNIVMTGVSATVPQCCAWGVAIESVSSKVSLADVNAVSIGSSDALAFNVRDSNLYLSNVFAQVSGTIYAYGLQLQNSFVSLDLTSDASRFCVSSTNNDAAFHSLDSVSDLNCVCSGIAPEYNMIWYSENQITLPSWVSCACAERASDYTACCGS